MNNNNNQIVLDYIKEHGMTKKQFAKMCKLTIYQLDGFFKGRNISSVTVYKIAVATGIRSDILLNYSI